MSKKELHTAHYATVSIFIEAMSQHWERKQKDIKYRHNQLKS